MRVTIPSFAKINLGLRIGALRADGFHELRTVYQTIGVHDAIRLSVKRGSGIEIRCNDPRVPNDSTNTCWRMVELAMAVLKARTGILIEIEKRLPVQGGLGGASGNAVATLLALERALRRNLPAEERLRIAAEVGSDLPLFLVGGTVLGVGRGEEVYPLPDLKPMPCVIALPEIAVSTPKAFAEWDRLCGAGAHARETKTGKGTASSRADGVPTIYHSELAKRSVACEELAYRPSHSGHPRENQVPRLVDRSRANEPHSLGMSDVGNTRKLKNPQPSGRMSLFSREISAWLSATSTVRRRSGVSARGGGRAENPLLDLVRTGIENDFEKVVFPQYPELREVKRVLERAGAKYASLSGSGSAIYGLFDSREKAMAAARKLERGGTQAVVTSTLTRRQYWKRLLALGS